MRRLAIALCAFSASVNAQDINTGAGAQAGAGAVSGSSIYYSSTGHHRSEPADFSRRAPFISIPSVQPTADCTKPINVGGTVGGLFGSNAFGLGGGWVYEDEKCRAMNAYLKAAETVNRGNSNAERFLKLSQCQIPEYWRNWEIMAMEQNDPTLKCPNTEPAGGMVKVQLRPVQDPASVSWQSFDERKKAKLASAKKVFPDGSPYSH